MPLLVKHFIEHREKDKNLSLWNFLNMHYAGNDAKDADYDEDMKLPFKSHNGCVTSFIIGFLPANNMELIAKPVYGEDKAYSDYVEKFLTPTYLSSIWQPPKSC